LYTITDIILNNYAVLHAHYSSWKNLAKAVEQYVDSAASCFECGLCILSKCLKHCTDGRVPAKLAWYLTAVWEMSGSWPKIRQVSGKNFLVGNCLLVISHGFC